VRNELHLEVARGNPSRDERRSDIDPTALAGVVHEVLVARQQFGECVSGGPLAGCAGIAGAQLEPVRHRRSVGRGIPPTDGDQLHSCRERGLESLPDGVRAEVLVEKEGDPLALGGHAQRQGLGEDELEAGIESLGGPDREPTATQRTLEQALEVEMAEEPRVAEFGEAQGSAVSQLGAGHGRNLRPRSARPGGSRGEPSVASRAGASNLDSIDRREGRSQGSVKPRRIRRARARRAPPGPARRRCRRRGSRVRSPPAR